MPMYDLKCQKCSHVVIDVFEPVTAPSRRCTRASEIDSSGQRLVCAGRLERVRLPGSTAAVIPDEIPGGIWIKNGLVNADGSPRKFYSKTEIFKEAKKRGLTNVVEHVGSGGSDKNRQGHTTRWV